MVFLDFVTLDMGNKLAKSLSSCSQQISLKGVSIRAKKYINNLVRFFLLFFFERISSSFSIYVLFFKVHLLLYSATMFLLDHFNRQYNPLLNEKENPTLHLVRESIFQLTIFGIIDKTKLLVGDLNYCYTTFKVCILELEE